jgi:Ca2+-binding EF-hand superfamily protein
MNRLLSIGTLIGIITFTFMATSFAWEESRFLGMDRNADGVITMDEVDAYRERLFKEYDLNGDGKVEYEEYVQAEHLRSAVMPANSAVAVPDEYREMDSDGDTVVTLEEIKAAGSARFKTLDKNGDGKISKDEFVSPGL